MKQSRIIAVLSCILLTACSAGQPADESAAPTRVPETTVVRQALGSNGHIFTSIAIEQGFFADEGITVEFVPVATDAEGFEAIKDGRIDIAANSGTNLPLENISKGMDLTIFGGYMLTGCMPIFARTDTEWNGIEDLIGSTMACEPNLFAVTGPLLDMGYQPLQQITWLNPEDQMDRIRAVESGEADFGLVGTSLNYEINSNPNLKVLTYADDILPDYSCCRAEALTSWVKENPNTVIAVLKGWIRAMEYYDSHHDETVHLTMKQIGQDEEYVRAYLDNPRCNLDVDPMKSAVERAWTYMGRLGLLDRDAAGMDIDEHINTELYKIALDECQAQYGSENPQFYERMQSQFAKNNQ